jgi:RHS repeat-associated protein
VTARSNGRALLVGLLVLNLAFPMPAFSGPPRPDRTVEPEPIDAPLVPSSTTATGGITADDPSWVLGTGPAAVGGGAEGNEKAGKPDDPVELSHGAYTRTIPIAVPPFHGIEPRLALSYNSQSGNGFVGVGWGLAGFSTIQRAGRGRGAPSYNDTDLFFLDGMELIPCAPGSQSPSCTNPDDSGSGTYYSTRIESFARIKRDTSANRWALWRKDGSRVTYDAVYTVGTPAQGFSKVFRWGISRVEDTHTNAVDYAWSCDPGADCYPDRVTYNGATVTLLRELRPDRISFGNGAYVGQTSYRLKTVKVEVGGQLARAYAVQYAAKDWNNATNRSVVSSVQQFGRSASVGGNGTITPGTGQDASLPAQQFLYSGSGALPSMATGTATGPTGNFCTATIDPTPASPIPPLLVPADFNGDGCTDFLTAAAATGTTAWLSSCDGTSSFEPPVTNLPAGFSGISLAQTQMKFGDLDGDGRTDFAFVPFTQAGGNFPVRLFLSNGDGTFTQASSPETPSIFVPPSVFSLTVQHDPVLVWPDLRWDPCCYRDYEGYCVGCRVQDPPYWYWPPDTYETVFTKNYQYLAASRIRVTDMDGDGRDDLVLFRSGGSYPIQTYRSLGLDAGGAIRFSAPVDGAVRTVAAPPPVPVLVHENDFIIIGYTANTEADMDRIRFADLNGDGATDLVALDGTAADPAVDTFLSNRDGTHSYVADAGPSFVFEPATYNTSQFGSRGDAIPSASRVRTGDFNGDGLQDLLIIRSGVTAGNSWDIYLSKGDGRFHPAIVATSGALNWNGARFDFNSVPVADLTGDGRTDFGYFSYPNLPTYLTEGFPVGGNPIARFAGAGPDLITHPHCVFEGDFDGDGKVDLAVAPVDTTGTVRIHLARTTVPADPTAATQPDLLKEVRNGYGATETIAYGSSSRTGSVGLPDFPVVTSVTRNDGRGHLSTTQYAYENGLFDRTLRKFLGFERVRKTLPALAGETNPQIEETRFLLDPRAQAEVLRTARCDGTSGMLTETFHTLATTALGPAGTAPFATFRTATDQYLFDRSANASCGADAPLASGAYRRTRTANEYDAFGNVSLEINFGEHYGAGQNPDVAGDEIATRTDRVPNGTKYIVALPSTTRTYAGTDPNGAKLQETLFYYDDASDFATSPVRGDLTRTDRWLDPPSASTAIPVKNVCDASAVRYWMDRAWEFARETLEETISFFAGAEGDPEYVVTRNHFDAAGNLEWSENEEGERTSYVYDPTHNLYPVEVRNPLNHLTQTTWDFVCGVPLRIVDPNGVVTRSILEAGDPSDAVDALCRPVRTEKFLPGGTVSTGSFESHVRCGVTVNPCGQPNAQYSEKRGPGPDGADDLFERTYFDGLQRPYRTEVSGPQVTRTIRTDTDYDARGNVASKSVPYYSDAARVYTETLTYDPIDRVKSRRHADRSTVTHVYGLGTTETTDEEQHVERTTVDVFGHTVRIERKVQGTFRTISGYEYDRLGRLTAIEDAYGNRETYTLDSLGRKIEIASPHVGTWRYRYDGAGRMLRREDALLQVTAFVYDDLGRMTQKTLRAGTCDLEAFAYAYDQVRPGAFNIGQRTFSGGAYGFAKYSHDALGRMVTELHAIGGRAYLFQKSFDAGGRLLWMSYPDRDTVGSPEDPIRYDAAGRVRSIPGVITDAVYDAMGHLTTQMNANGTTITRVYSEPRGWLESVIATGPDGLLYDVEYPTIDLDGKVRDMLTSSPTTGDGERWSRFVYDDLHQLTSAQSGPIYGTFTDVQNFTYDLSGNIQTNSRLGTYRCAGTTQCPAPSATIRPHSVTHVGVEESGYDYLYDANGNMRVRMGSPITYDGENRPTWLASALLTYDADGRRIQKDLIGAHTVYFGDDVEIGACQLTKSFPFGSFLVAQRGAGGTEWSVTDHVGSVLSLIAGSGEVVWTQRYRPYGEILTGEEQTSSSSRGFTGQRQDESGLVYLHARYYDPVIGRFVSPDPLTTADPAGLNPYAYAANDPVNRTDTSGLAAEGGEPKTYAYAGDPPNGFTPSWFDANYMVPVVDGVEVTAEMSQDRKAEALWALADLMDGRAIPGLLQSLGQKSYENIGVGFAFDEDRAYSFGAEVGIGKGAIKGSFDPIQIPLDPNSKPFSSSVSFRAGSPQWKSEDELVKLRGPSYSASGTLRWNGTFEGEQKVTIGSASVGVTKAQVSTSKGLELKMEIPVGGVSIPFKNPMISGHLGGVVNARILIDTQRFEPDWYTRMRYFSFHRWLCYQHQSWP